MTMVLPSVPVISETPTTRRRPSVPRPSWMMRCSARAMVWRM